MTTCAAVQDEQDRGQTKMCGIGAFQIVDNEINAQQIARVLLRLLEVRGRDASGVAWHSNGKTYIHKGAIAGSALAKQVGNDIGATGIVHTRYATQGSPKNSANNHPIDVGGIVGVHNGHIANDDELIAECIDYKRNGQVDSEAAFAILQHGDQAVPLVERLAKIKGGAALLWINSHAKTETLHAARLTNSPLWLGQTVAGSIVYASTDTILRETAKRCGFVFDYIYDLSEGEYIRSRKGVLMDSKTIPMPKKATWLQEWQRTNTYTYTKQSAWEAEIQRGVQHTTKPMTTYGNRLDRMF